MKPIDALCTRSFTIAQLERLRQIASDLVIRQEVNTGLDSSMLASVLTPDVEILFTRAPPSHQARAGGLQGDCI
jgi:hypothetical protein